MSLEDLSFVWFLPRSYIWYIYVERRKDWIVICVCVYTPDDSYKMTFIIYNYLQTFSKRYVHDLHKGVHYEERHCTVEMTTLYGEKNLFVNFLLSVDQKWTG